MCEKCRNGRRTSIRRVRRSGWPLGPRGPRTERVSGMTNTRRVSALVSTALMIGALSACDGEAAAPSSTETASQTPTSSTTTIDPTPTDAEVAEAAATEVVQKYFAAVDQLRQDSRVPLGILTRVTLGGELDAQTIFTRNQRAEGYRQVGDTELVHLLTQAVSLDGGTNEPPTVQIDACWDVSAVDVLDGDGASIVSPDRLERGWTRYTVVNSNWKKRPDSGWRVTSSRDLQKAPCSGD
jgi:hypothetical protein